MALAVQLENVSKRYRLGEIGTGTLSQDLERMVARYFGRPDPFAKIGNSTPETSADQPWMWAVRDLDIEIQQGEVLGIIGRNGAGKSTLLKLLSRITAPTTGTIRAKGRIASLLEVGTGFHPELTGRENVYLNGAILGMTRSEVKHRFDQIIEFSGCGRHIDTPVKRYSSGMLVRLGFSVAAHLDCEILIVDEVLAVGDAEFQKRCLGRLSEISGQQGRTVLFVSHNLVSVERLCSRGVLLDQGTMRAHGEVATVLTAYQQLVHDRSVKRLVDREDRIGNGAARVADIRVSSDDFSDQATCRSGSAAQVEVDLEVSTATQVDVHLGIRDLQGTNLGHLAVTTATGTELRIEKPGPRKILFEIPKLPLAEGVYSITVFVTANGEVADWVQEATVFQVVSGDFYGTGKLPPSGQARILIEHSIRTNP